MAIERITLNKHVRQNTGAVVSAAACGGTPTRNIFSVGYSDYGECGCCEEEIVLLTAPDLADPGAQVVARGDTINIQLTNNGGEADSYAFVDVGTSLGDLTSFGLSFNSSTGAITGTVAAGATVDVWPIRITATNSKGTSTVNYNLDIRVALDIDLDDSNAGDSDYSTTFTQGDSPVAVADVDVVIADTSVNGIDEMTITLAGFVDGNEEILDFNGTSFPAATDDTGTATVGGTTFSIAFSSGVFTVTNNAGGAMPVADLQSFIEAITYEHTGV